MWDMNLTDRHGIERYPFGPEGSITLTADSRRSANDEPRINVDSNVPFRLRVIYGKDKEKTIDVTPGKNRY